VRGVKLQELEAIIEFVYQVRNLFYLFVEDTYSSFSFLLQGEVNISNDHLSKFLLLGKDLKVTNLFEKRPIEMTSC
jgi:hypothetical protein